VKLRALVAGAAIAALAMSIGGPAPADDDPDYGQPDRPLTQRGDRFVPKPAGTREKLRFWFGPYVVPPGHDANRVDLELPLINGYMVAAEPGLRYAQDVGEPSRQEAHIHHSHWFALDPGNEEDNYTGGNTEWIFGNGDEETRADFEERSAADPNGPIYGEYVAGGNPQVMIYMLHNKTSRPLNVYVVLDVTFVHGTEAELGNGQPRPYRDVAGVLFGRTFDVPRNPFGDGVYTTTRDHPRGAIEWTATMDGTIIGTGGHLHPGGLNVLVENMGSEQNPCPDDGRGTGGTRLLNSKALWRNGVKFSEDFQMSVTHPAWRAPVRKGDRIRITGVYENRDHGWYTAMTHEGLYIDEQQPPVGRCKPYLIGDAAKPTVKYKKVRKKVVRWKKKRYRDERTGRMRVKRVRRVKIVRKRKRVLVKPDPTVGVPNRPWGKHADLVCGVEIGSFPCDRPERPRGPGQFTSQVTIANFLYLPGDTSLGDSTGNPPRVYEGESLQFLNADQAAGIRHSVTTCRWPCNGRYVANYPLPDGVWDSTTLGYDPVDGGNPNPVAQTPTTLKPGKYSYYCRIHPWMRGAFEVVPRDGAGLGLSGF